MFRLAWRNVSRDWTRSLLAISGMALAALILTSSLALANTYHAGAQARYRFALGGDVIAIPGHFLVDKTIYGGTGAARAGGSAPTAAAAASRWSLRQWDQSWQGNLGQFVPGVGSTGYLAPQGHSDVFRLDVVDAARPALEKAGVKAVYPYLSLPAFTVSDKNTYATPLRARQPAIDQEWIRQDSGDTGSQTVTRLVTGRWLQPLDDGKMVAIVSANRPAEAGPAPMVGSNITVAIPAVSVGPDGRLSFDFGHRRNFQVEVVGLYDVTLEMERDQEGWHAVPWETGEVAVPAQTFAAMYQAVAGGVGPAVAGQLGLVVKDMTRMGQTLQALNKAFPEWTFLSAPQLTAMMNRSSGGAIPADMSGVFVAVSFLLAGALVAGNMYVIVHQRSKQIGILKSIGASGPQVFGMVLIEVAGYALVGGLAGWILVVALYSLVVLSSGVGLAAFATKAATTFLLVQGTTLGVAALFGLAPAWLAAAQPPARVLRND